jgi:hypothetical protein
MTSFREPPNMPTTWSYSKWEMWSMCPLRYKLTHVDKGRPFERSPAMERGDKIHKDIAAHLQPAPESPAPPLPADVVGYARQLMGEIRAIPGRIIEQKWAYDAEWRPVGYFANNTWLRNILDVGLPYDDGTFETVDWKTGKQYDTNADQMECFAVTIMGRFHETGAREVKTRLVYIDAETQEVETYHYRDFANLSAKWTANANKMLADRVWLPKPNAKCKWCPFSRSKGGPCRYG